MEIDRAVTIDYLELGPARVSAYVLHVHHPLVVAVCDPERRNAHAQTGAAETVHDTGLSSRTSAKTIEHRGMDCWLPRAHGFLMPFWLPLPASSRTPRPQPGEHARGSQPSRAEQLLGTGKVGEIAPGQVTRFTARTRAHADSHGMHHGFGPLAPPPLGSLPRQRIHPSIELLLASIPRLSFPADRSARLSHARPTLRAYPYRTTTFASDQHVQGPVHALQLQPCLPQVHRVRHENATASTALTVLPPLL